jgi:serine/threonine protein kinase
MPDSELAQKDVPSRWVIAARRQKQDPEMGSIQGSRTAATPKSTRRVARRPDDDDDALHDLVMFSDAHVRELQPADWREQLIGKGSFGAVYRATWRGKDVAVKELLLPSEPQSAGAAAKAALARRVQQITKDFVSEVEVCADLAHPNLVRLMGYSSKPRLLIVQEMMLGQSVDKQLYLERWRPSQLQVLKVALDVAHGMKYLHSNFEQPIIHRDLKCGNLLMQEAPPARGTPETNIVCKIADFGLSRDKQITEEVEQTSGRLIDYREGGTEQMTGCGSVLWMAPEILLGDTYNEKVDVYSYAMCLVELIDCDLPWHGWRFAAEVPFKVIQSERPSHQIRSASDELRALVGRMWGQVAARRPSFAEIVEELEALYAAAGGRRSVAAGGAVGDRLQV